MKAKLNINNVDMIFELDNATVNQFKPVYET